MHWTVDLHKDKKFKQAKLASFCKHNAEYALLELLKGNHGLFQEINKFCPTESLYIFFIKFELYIET